MAMLVFLVSFFPVGLLSCIHDDEMPFDCSELYNSGQNFSGVYSIYPVGDTPVRVNCHMVSGGKDVDNGGWTVIQRRMDGRMNFYQPWKEYKRGFGDVESEYWLGLENLYQLTRKQKYMLRVDVEDFVRNKVFALYSSFSVDCESDGYKLHVSGFTDGGGGDSLSAHTDQMFSTFDKDQDSSASYHCAKYYLGGFWYNSCFNTNPNGLYIWDEVSSYSNIGVFWQTWKTGKNIKSFSMKIKRKTF